MKIPEDLLQTIRDRVSIAEVVGAHVSLKRAGRSLKGLCPFHTEKTPSFTVNEERGTYKCFGCGKGGNAFTFLMEVEGRTFREAAELLASRAGVALPREEESEEDRARRREREAIHEILELAARYYRHQFTEGRAGQAAREYAEKRGIGAETAEKFSIGAAPPGWDNLARWLEKKKMSLALGERAGLLAKRDSGGYYDRFRDRLMFPIADAMGRTVSFGGRVLGAGEPKYLNGPETEVFHKGKVLYGLFQGAEALRRAGRALLVEGYMDVVILHQRGISGCLATLGTALTRDHVEAIRRRADSAVLIYDGDAAGRKAMERSLEIFLSEGFPCKGVALPQGEDPDSFAGAGNDLMALVEAAPSLFETCLGFVASRHDLSRVEGRVGAVAEITPALRSVADDLIRSEYVKRAAEFLRVDESLLARRARPAEGDGEDAAPVEVAATRADPLEAALLRRLIHEPERRAKFMADSGEKWFDDERHRAAALFAASRTEGADSFPIELAPASLRDLMTGLVMEDVPGEYGQIAEALEKRRLQRMADDLSRRMKEAEARAAWDEWTRLSKEKSRLDKEIRGP